MSSIAFNLPAVANKALENSLLIFARDVVGATIAYLREKDIDIRRSDLDALTLATAIGCGAVTKTVEEKPKAPRKAGVGRKPKSATVVDDDEAAFPKYEWFPFCNVVYAGRCNAIVARGGLMNQCLAAPKEGCEFCAKCEKKRIGDIRTRVCEGDENTKAFVLTTVKDGKTTKKSPTSLAKYLADFEKRKSKTADAADYKADDLMEKAKAEAERLSRVLGKNISISDWDCRIEKKQRGRKSSSGSSGDSKSSKTEVSVDELNYAKVLKDLDKMTAPQIRKLLAAVAEKAGVKDDIKDLKKKADMVAKLKELCENELISASTDEVSDEEAKEAEKEEEASDEEEDKASEEEEEEKEVPPVHEDARVEAEAEAEDEEEIEFDEEDEEDEDEETAEEKRLIEKRRQNCLEYDVQAYKGKSYKGKEVAIRGNEVYAYDTETETVGDVVGKVQGGKVAIFKSKITEEDATDKTKTKTSTRSSAKA